MPMTVAAIKTAIVWLVGWLAGVGGKGGKNGGEGDQLVSDSQAQCLMYKHCWLLHGLLLISCLLI